uniref:Lactate permease n=1 Tax=Streptomyces atratus TaxID=1893 RepID=A0A286MYQ6_STRAR|nr:lactate permease [Streptomyces atratus]
MMRPSESRTARSGRLSADRFGLPVAQARRGRPAGRAVRKRRPDRCGRRISLWVREAPSLLGCTDFGMHQVNPCPNLQALRSSIDVRTLWITQP